MKSLMNEGKRNEGFKFWVSWKTKKWIKSGLTPDDYHFAAYLRGKGHGPQKIDKHKLKELSKESWDAQIINIL